MGKIKNKVIIWASDDYNALAMLRQVGQGTDNILLLVNGKASYASRSKYCPKYLETSSMDDAFQYLINARDDYEVPPVILTSGDGIISYIDLHKTELKDWYVLPGTEESGLVTRYNDKNEMTRLAAEVGITIPVSKRIQWNSNIDDIPYPCMVKPAHQKPGHHNEFKFKLCVTRDELAHTLKYVNHDSEFIAQQYIEREKDLLVYGARMRDGEVVFAGSLATDRFAVGQGSSYGKVYKEIPSCINQIAMKEFLCKIDYYGLFSFEYGLNSGNAYFFEVNLRNDGTSHFFFQAGANLPLAYVYSCAGLDYQTIQTTVETEPFYIDEMYDISNVITGAVSLKEWKRQRGLASVFKFYDSLDMVPYKMVKNKRWLRIVRDIVLKEVRLYYVFLVDKIKSHVIAGGGNRLIYNVLTQPIVAYC